MLELIGRVRRVVLGAGLAAGLSAVAGCGTDKPGPESTAATGLALTADVLADTDVTGMRFEVVRVSCAAESVPNQVFVADEDLMDVFVPGGIPQLGNQPLDQGSTHIAADHFFALEPGCYDVTTTPFTAAGVPSLDCAPAVQRGVVVTAGQTTEILAVNQCRGGDGTGALDLLATLNHAPEILDLTFPSTKFTTRCLESVACATVRDPDGDPLELAWAPVSGPPPNFEGPLVLSRTDNPDGSVTECVSIVPLEAGRYEFTITA
jgi:hypothetical protein